jgi:hypothetical protein
MQEPFFGALDGHRPQIAESAFVAPATVVVGRVRIGALSSVWYRGVLRGDDEEIVIGEDTNVQDFSMRVSARWRITERFRARGTKTQVLMPTLKPTRATPGGTRRTTRFSLHDEMGLFIGFCGRSGTRRTL